MSTKDDGGPAFPTAADNGHSTNQDGMSLRDYFAAKAMQGLVAASWNQDGFVEYAPGAVATSAYEMADAMLEAREK